MTPEQSSHAPRMSSADVLGKLLRISLLPSAAADALAGVALGAAALGVAPSAAEWLRVAVPQVLASLAVYHGGMALNDVADRAHDAAMRPERPLPSGAISLRSAVLIGSTLVVLGPGLGYLNGQATALTLAVVALLAVLYDFVGRGPIRGPALLGLCRFGNVAAGIFAGASMFATSQESVLPPLVWLAPAGYAAYVAGLSGLGRLEDDPERPPGRAPRAWILLIACLLLLAPLLGALATGGLFASTPARGALATPGKVAALVLAIAAARGLTRVAKSPGEEFDRTDVMRAMGAALRRLLIYTSALSLAAGTALGALTALLILGGYPLSHALRRRFPPS